MKILSSFYISILYFHFIFRILNKFHSWTPDLWSHSPSKLISRLKTLLVGERKRLTGKKQTKSNSLSSIGEFFSGLNVVEIWVSGVVQNLTQGTSHQFLVKLHDDSIILNQIFWECYKSGEEYRKINIKHEKHNSSTDGQASLPTLQTSPADILLLKF